MTIAVLVISFFGLLLIGAPVAVALGAATVFTSLLFNPIPPEIIGQKVLDNVDHFTLMAVPFFFLAAGLMETLGYILSRPPVCPDWRCSGWWDIPALRSGNCAVERLHRRASSPPGIAAR